MPTVLYSEALGLGDGDPTIALPGTGTSVPRGLEAVFSYNGLIFNDTSTVDKYRVTNIDGLDDPDIRDSREDNVATHGETAYDSFYGGRTLAITGRIESWTANKLRDMQQALRSAFADLTEHPLYFLTGVTAHDHFINVKKFSKLQWGEEQKDDLFFRDFLITVRASNPRFYSVSTKVANLNYGAGMRQIDLSNLGNFEAQPSIDIYGPVDTPALYNSTTDELLLFKTTCTIDATTDVFYRIRFDNGGVTVVNSHGTNKFNQLAFTSDRLTISPQEVNSLQANTSLSAGANGGTGATTKFILTYNNSWI